MRGESDHTRIRAALDLLDLVDEAPAVNAGLTAGGTTAVDLAVQLLSPHGDRTTRAAINRHLHRVGAVDSGTVDLRELGHLLTLCMNIRAELERRRPPASSQLVVTATSALEVTAVRDELGIRPLLHLVQDVVRTADERCILAAPYWNEAAFHTLWPAIEGFARRAGHLELICQGNLRADDLDPRPSLRRVATDVAGEGGTCEIWTFEVSDASGFAALLHAKFALADDRYGYLGSANMTEQGFGRHFEIGVQLGPAESIDLARLVGRLKYAGFLVPDA